MINIQRSIVNIIEGELHDHLMSTRTFTLMMKICIEAPKFVKNVATASTWIIATNHMFHILGEVSHSDCPH